MPPNSKKPSFSIYAPFCKVEGGREYKVTFWAKAVDATGGLYVLYPTYNFYKGELKSPKYIDRITNTITTPSFEWRKIERIIPVPQEAEWLRIYIATRATIGNIYIDDISILPVSSSAKEEREERARLYFKSLDAFFRVSEEYETPHIKWLKPYSKDKIKVLYMSYMWRLDDINKRDVVELNQRMDINYKFVPLLNKKTGQISDFTSVFSKEMEPYILDVVGEELKKDYDVVIVNKINFRGLQNEFISSLLEAVRKGKGLILTSCTNLPAEINNLLTKENLVKLPENFYCMPEVNKALKEKSQLPQICKMWQLERGKIVTIDERNFLYSCVPADKSGELYPNQLGREIPYWEYKFFPLIKSIAYVSGKESGVKINNYNYKDGVFNLKIESDIEVDAKIEVVFNNFYKQIEEASQYPVRLRRGDNEVSFPLVKLPGGNHIADLRLMSHKGLIYDFGSYSFDTPLLSEIKEIKFTNPKRYYKAREEVKAEVGLNNIEEGLNLNWYVEDSYDRIVKKGSYKLNKGEDKVFINFTMDSPLTIINWLFVALEKDNEVIHLAMEEFSTPFNFPPTDELIGYGWFAFHGSYGFRMWKENGFDAMANSVPRYKGLFKALSTANLRPDVYGLLYRAGDPDKGERYRGDQGKEGDDIIRKPCFSDPDWWGKIKEVVGNSVKNDNLVYFGVRDYSLGDECFLGSNVCYSEWCLKDFREYLKKEYKDLQYLNKSWVTQFKSWEEVTPLQLKEVKAEKNNMASWLDHKIFMTTIFARIGEKMKNIIEAETSGEKIRIGFSGSQNPGHSYNWWELMKYMDCWQNYDGMQQDLIRSYRQPGTTFGQWVGYAPEYIDAEKYSKYYVWKTLFHHANCYAYFHSGYALMGDLVYPNNTKFALEELKKVKQGIDKLLLSSEQVCDIGIHYSQSSLFASTATIGRNVWSGAIDSWSRIINDLGLNFKFISYEQLKSEGLDKNKYKVFILPVSISLSEKEIDALRKYVESGGLLISDFGVGMYDEHGKKIQNKQLWSIFGIEREENSEIVFGGSGIRVKDAKKEGLKSRSVQLRFGEANLNLTSGKAYGETESSKTPTVIINKLGKGKAILLNCVINDYAQITLTGVGGEVTEVKKGVIEVNEATKGFVRDIFGSAEVVSGVEIKTDKGVDLLSSTKTSIWRNGQTTYVGFLNEPEKMYSRIKASDNISGKMLFKDKGYLYDVKA